MSHTSHAIHRLDRDQTPLVGVVVLVVIDQVRVWDGKLRLAAGGVVPPAGLAAVVAERFAHRSDVDVGDRPDRTVAVGRGRGHLSMMHQSSARLVGPILGARTLWQVSLARTRAHVSDHPTEPRGAVQEWVLSG